MQRVAIIGNAGGGKSVLARKLGELLNCPVYPFDDLQWQPGWILTPAEEIQATHSEWISQPEWIIDGWGSWDILKARFEAADTIIFVDFPLAVHYWWAAKRQIKAGLKINSGWPPAGCKGLPVTGRLFRLMWKIHSETRPQLIVLIDQYAEGTRLIHLQSPRGMRSFVGNMNKLPTEN
jgi:hypothetical protein